MLVKYQPMYLSIGVTSLQTINSQFQRQVFKWGAIISQSETQLMEIARKCRIDIVEMVHKAGAGHPGGSLSAINGIGTEELTITKLLKRIEQNEITEVILALSTTMEGQTTTHVIADKLEAFKDLTVTRLAQGIPIGGEVHYLDENTLNTAFQSRKKIV